MVLKSGDCLEGGSCDVTMTQVRDSPKTPCLQELSVLIIVDTVSATGSRPGGEERKETHLIEILG